MHVVKVALGFAPTVTFSVLVRHRGAGWAAGACLLVAAAVTIGTSRGGVDILSGVQAAVLLVTTVRGPDVDQDLMELGPSVSGLLLGTFMIATAARFPSAAQVARQQVAGQLWHRSLSLEVNQRISTSWRLAVRPGRFLAHRGQPPSAHGGAGWTLSASPAEGRSR